MSDERIAVVGAADPNAAATIPQTAAAFAVRQLSLGLGGKWPADRRLRRRFQFQLGTRRRIASRLGGSGETGGAVEESTSTLRTKELAMNAVRQYSTYFSCLYDEPGPVGSLGRGTHYSVLRSVEWLDVQRRRLPIPHVHDFAVIWDEDHDERVIDAIERIYLAGLLSPVQFIGERKGGLSVIVASPHYWAPRNEADAYKRALEAIGQSLDDPWPIEIGCFDRRMGSPQNRNFEGIISGAENRVELYLANIDSLWELGTRPFVPRTSAWVSAPAIPSQPSISPPIPVPQPFPPGGVLPPST